MRIHRRCTARKHHGEILVELVAVATFLAVCALVGVDCSVPLFAAWTNDAACRDAARAASMQSNPSSALQAAEMTVSKFTGNFCHVTVSTQGNDFEYQLFPDPKTGRPQFDKGPYVRVTTQLTFSLPVTLVGMPNPLIMKQGYCFPLNPS